MNTELKQNSQQVWLLQYYACASTLALIVFLILAFQRLTPIFDRIRASGLIIEDKASHYKNGDQFMDWYKGLSQHHWIGDKERSRGSSFYVKEIPVLS